MVLCGYNSNNRLTATSQAASGAGSTGGQRRGAAANNRFLYRDDLKLHTTMALCGVCCYNKISLSKRKHKQKRDVLSGEMK